MEPKPMELFDRSVIFRSDQSFQVKPKYYTLSYALSHLMATIASGEVLNMSEEASDLSNFLDQSVLASLRELQDEGDPDIVAEVGGLFLKHSPDKVNAVFQALENDDAKALQLAAHSLKSSSAYIGAMRLSSLAKDLEMMGRSGALEGARDAAERLQEEFDLATKALQAEIARSDQQQKKI
jgi:HPt (histidine-containing phosphotransfer) domain-containing protein